MVQYPGASTLEEYSMTYESRTKGVKFSKLSPNAILNSSKTYDMMKLGKQVAIITCPTCESNKGQIFIYDLAKLNLITVQTGG